MPAQKPNLNDPEVFQRVFKQAQDIVYDDVIRYFSELHEPFRASWASQRYYRITEKLGYRRIIDFIRLDPRLLIKTTKKGAQIIVPKEAYEKHVKELYDGDYGAFWKAFGVSVV